MGKFILGIFAGVILLCCATLIYFASGMAPVATSAKAMPFEKRLASMALDARVHKEAPTSPPAAPDEAGLVASAQVYSQNCAVCHGLPDQPRSAIATGMFPRPPQLFNGKGVSDDPVAETYWKVSNGIRLTGMPAFKDSLSDQQIWQVSYLLAGSDKLPASVQQALHSAKMEASAPASTLMQAKP